MMKVSRGLAFRHFYGVDDSTGINVLPESETRSSSEWINDYLCGSSASLWLHSIQGDTTGVYDLTYCNMRGNECSSVCN